MTARVHSLIAMALAGAVLSVAIGVARLLAERGLEGLLQ